MCRCNQFGFLQDGAPEGHPTLVTRLVQPIYDEVRISSNCFLMLTDKWGPSVNAHITFLMPSPPLAPQMSTQQTRHIRVGLFKPITFSLPTDTAIRGAKQLSLRMALTSRVRRNSRLRLVMDSIVVTWSQTTEWWTVRLQLCSRKGFRR